MEIPDWSKSIDAVVKKPKYLMFEICGKIQNLNIITSVKIVFKLFITIFKINLMHIKSLSNAKNLKSS